MASSEEEMREVVIVTIPDPTAGELPSAEDQEKTVLVTAELAPQTG